MEKGAEGTMMPLGLMSPGEKGEIVNIRAHLHGKHREGGSCCGSCGPDRKKGDVRIEDMGFRIGKVVEMLNNSGGPILLRIDESRIAIDRGMAMKIMVRR